MLPPAGQSHKLPLVDAAVRHLHRALLVYLLRLLPVTVLLVDEIGLEAGQWWCSSLPGGKSEGTAVAGAGAIQSRGQEQKQKQEQWQRQGQEQYQ